MKWYCSIRWRIQLWHGLVFVFALAGFGVTAWQLQRLNQLYRIDRELEQRIGIVSKPFRNSDDPPPRRRRPDADLSGQPPPRNEGWFPDRILVLSEREAEAFEGSPGHPFYYVAWLSNGRIATASASAPSDIPKAETIPGSPSFRSRGNLRECFHTGRSGECVLVGRDIEDDLAGIRRFGWLLGGVGGGVLVLGLLGGSWISRRALRPISDISATAAMIAAGDLSQRIRITNSESELGQLAQDLNDTFSQFEASFLRQAQFTADASHELRTPVTVVLTQTQSALARERSVSEYRESLGACQRAAQRMRGLIQGLLTLARLDAENATADPGPCQLDQITRDTAEALHGTAAAKQVTLQLDLAPVQCRGHADQLAQVVFNLVSNAIDYNRAGGIVRVALDCDKDSAILNVQDSGLGIDSEDLPHVFERFYRADKSRSGSHGHSGLGLSIVKAIVEAHAGSIDVASQPRVGACFSVRLPLGSII